MFFAQAPSADRPAFIETSFNPYSIVKAGLVSEMMDDGLLMHEACRKAGMSSATYRHALLAGKAQPPKNAVIRPARFSAKTVAKYRDMERLMSLGFLQSQAATEVGASSECYSIWRLQTAATPVAAPVRDTSNKRYDPVQSTFEEVRDFAAEQRQQVQKQSAGFTPGRMKFVGVATSVHLADKGAKVVHGDRTGRATIISSDGLGADWHITSVKRTDSSLTVKAVLSTQGQKDLAAAKAKGGQAHLDHVLGVITKLSSLGPNPLSEDWKVDQIEGDLSGITATCSPVEKTKDQLDEEKLIEMLTFLRRASNGENLANLAGVLSDFPGGEGYQAALRAMKATRH